MPIKRLADKAEEIKAARIHLVRYFAFSNSINYVDAENICNLNRFRKKDILETTEYYIEKGWMTGKPLKPHGEYIQGCKLDALYQCAIIAHCPFTKAKTVLADARDTSYENIWRHYTENEEEEAFLLIAEALNAYCQCHPETLSVFPDMDDIPTRVSKANTDVQEKSLLENDLFPDIVDKPIAISDEKEERWARQRWEELSQKLTAEQVTGADISPFVVVMDKPEFMDFFRGMPSNLICNIIAHKSLDYQSLNMIPEDILDYYLQLTTTAQRPNEQPFYEEVYDHLQFYQHFLRYGNIDEHLAKMHPHTKPFALLSALKFMNEGKANDAVKTVEACLKKRDLFLFDDVYSNFIYCAALLKADSAASLKMATSLSKKKLIKERATPLARLMLEMKAHPETDFTAWVKTYGNNSNCSLLHAALFSLIATTRGYSDNYKDVAEQYAILTLEQNIRVLALELAQVSDVYKKNVETLQEETQMKPLLDKVKRKEQWELLLDTMLLKFGEESADGKKKKPKDTSKEVARVVYEVNTNNYDVQPRLKKSKDGGVTWSGGRNIALKTFEKGIPEMTPQDVIVSKLVKTYSYGWYGGVELYLGGSDVVAALVGHPYVYDHHNPNIKIEIQEEKLQVQVKEAKAGYKVSYNVKNDNGTYRRISVVKENAQLLKVIRLSPQETELLHLFDRVDTFPLEAKEQLTKLLAVLGKRVTVMSPLLGKAQNAKMQMGNSMLTVQVVPYGDMFTVRSFVKPLVDTPPYCSPGHGLEYIAASVKGENIQVARDLKAERKNQKELQSWMQPFDEYASDGYWQMPIEECLAVLDLLRQHPETCRIEWPEGVRFAVKRPMIGADQLRLSVNGVGHWFEVNGEVNIDDKTSLKISELLKRVRESKGRFIQLDDTEYIAISRDLQKQLVALDRVMQTEKKQLKVSEFNSSFLHDLQLSGISLTGDESYQSLQTRMEEADRLKIRVPKMLQAELRDYQMDGYRWMCRLAHWGAGACLADDMGLGKTVQTIALLLSRASQGASLVIMPTSVLINWQNELHKFAPTLNPVILRQAQDRKKAIDDAGKNDIVLATYGLLPTEEELLTAKKWNVIVLDEAHTIKNKDTKTSKVAMQLEGDFRLLLTGTPLQNHLSEIWNLFQFATPGLLTDYKQFTQEFINPIERDQEKEPQRLLKRMLSPFILRRTKNEVLNELPEKTEITLKVELSDDERALYNHLREEAILTLEDGGRTSAIKALAEITKLRQVACNAALVLPAKEAKKIPSSKCEAFMKLIDELIQNHHRALVFSQFTSHLHLIEKQLKRQGIDYQYLDGAVSPTERIRRVDDFQKGEQPLFLISLKAGGTGLNLTSADYVIHLDPWWNPSIEDQASDRAYRIGQDKPATVYRLIAADTIEEKIIALHQTKKSLADALLEGSDMAHKLSTDEILQLIRG